MEKRIQDELNTLKKIIAESVPVERNTLFGSFASAMPNANSDLDMYVIMPESVDMREIDAMRLIHRAIRDKKTMPVDIVVSKENKFNSRKAAPTIERTIAQEGVVVYGQ